MRFKFDGGKVADTYRQLKQAEALRAQFEQTHGLNSRRVDLEEERMAQTKADFENALAQQKRDNEFRRAQAQAVANRFGLTQGLAERKFGAQRSDSAFTRQQAAAQAAAMSSMMDGSFATGGPAAAGGMPAAVVRPSGGGGMSPAAIAQALAVGQPNAQQGGAMPQRAPVPPQGAPVPQQAAVQRPAPVPQQVARQDPQRLQTQLEPPPMTFDPQLAPASERGTDKIALAKAAQNAPDVPQPEAVPQATPVPLNVADEFLPQDRTQGTMFLAEQAAKKAAAAPTGAPAETRANYDWEVKQYAAQLMKYAQVNRVKNFTPAKAKLMAEAQMDRPRPAAPANSMDRLSKQLARKEDVAGLTYMTEAAKAEAKLKSEALYEVGKTAMGASGAMVNLNRLRENLSTMNTGKGYDLRVDGMAWTEGLYNAGLIPESLRDKASGLFGVKMDEVGKAQATQAAINQLLTGMIGNTGEGEGGMPANNFSNKDLQFLIKSLVSLSNEPEANMMIMDVLQLNEVRKIYKHSWMAAEMETKPKTTMVQLGNSWLTFISSPEGIETLTKYEVSKTGGMNYAATLAKVRAMSAAQAQKASGAVTTTGSSAEAAQVESTRDAINSLKQMMPRK